MLKSFEKLLKVTPIFQTEQVLTLSTAITICPHVGLYAIRITGAPIPMVEILHQVKASNSIVKIASISIEQELLR